MLSGDEEVGSAASRPFLERQCMGADAVLVFEGAIGDAVKTARKGIGRFVIDVVGVEAHAGVEPEKGASAIHELGSLIPRVLSIARAEEGTSVNIGVVSGGSRVNVTTARVRLELEARIRGSAEAARVESELEALAAADPRIRLEVRGSWERPVFERTASVAALYRRPSGSRSGSTCRCARSRSAERAMATSSRRWVLRCSTDSARRARGRTRAPSRSALRACWSGRRSPPCWSPASATSTERRAPNTE